MPQPSVFSVKPNSTGHLGALATVMRAEDRRYWTEMRIECFVLLGLQMSRQVSFESESLRAISQGAVMAFFVPFAMSARVSLVPR